MAQTYSSIADHTHLLDGGAAKLSELQHSDPTLVGSRHEVKRVPLVGWTVVQDVGLSEG